MAEYLQKLPLYHQQEHAKHINAFAPGINKGLLFDRWFGGYDNNWQVDKLQAGGNSGVHPLSWLAGECGNRALLDRARERHLALVSHLGGSAISSELDWHMVTGTGEAHPLENGFRWHHGLSVPYLPASSIKGMLRAWLTCWDTDIFTREEIILLLGNERASDEVRIGDLILFDALPIDCPILTLDVMTPHAGDWYQKGSTKPNSPETVPADWQSPVPLTFLAVKQAKFVFSMAARSQQAQALLSKAIVALDEALSTLGIGAKTAAGYGVMRRITAERPDSGEQLLAKVQARRDQARQHLVRQRVVASLSPHQLLIHQMTERLDAQNSAAPALRDKHRESLNSEVGNLVNQALSEQWAPTERQALISMIREHSRWLNIAKKDKARERKALIAQLEV